ncbi:MAG: hypothetical protein KDC53_24420, partial [Saprospiraceae bacterium]|nr:hypothetical protein [Saprospiraceae bacterium]
MQPDARKRFNNSFSLDKYQNLLEDVYYQFNHRPNFRIAETPVFIDSDLQKRLFEACDQISSALCRKDFKTLTEASLEDSYRVPGEDEHTTFLQMDFGICRDAEGNLVPKLIEAQGFPSLYLYQDMIAQLYRRHFDIPENCSHLFNLTSEEYIELLRRIIVGDCKPENVVLLEIEPHFQTTRIDFLCTEEKLNIKTLCISDLKTSGRNLFYLNEQGKKVDVHRIYNRVIFDELLQRHDLKTEFFFTREWDVEWVGHPNWFFRISKYTLPLFDSPYVPKTWFLKDLTQVPDDLENYVLKPMFSFSGSGVIFHLNREAFEKTNNPSNYILQEKVKYEPVIQTPNDPVKCEIRMLLLWPKDSEKPYIVNNLARLSKGEMIGVKYNKDKDWV